MPLSHWFGVIPNFILNKTLLSMIRKYKICDQAALYFVTFTVIQGLDVFARREYRDIFLDSIRYCQMHKGLEVCAY